MTNMSVRNLCHVLFGKYFFTISSVIDALSSFYGMPNIHYLEILHIWQPIATSDFSQRGSLQQILIALTVHFRDLILVRAVLLPYHSSSYQYYLTHSLHIIIPSHQLILFCQYTGNATILIDYTGKYTLFSSHFAIYCECPQLQFYFIWHASMKIAH